MPVVLYERQRQILDYVAQFIQRNAFAPNLRNIADAMNLRSLATVHEHLDILEQKGVIKVTGQAKRRNIKIIDKRMTDIDLGVKLPILGFFSEGKVIEPYLKTDALFAVAPSMISGKKRSFVLKVKGDSLEPEAILENDLLILEEDSKVKNGEVVVALLEDNTAVLKRLFKETTRVKLAPIRSKKDPIYVEKVKIQGKVVGIIRNY